MPNMQHSKERLIREIRAGQIYGAISEKVVVRDGRVSTEYSTRILRRFKNPKGCLSSSTFFRKEDLPRLAMVASKAFQYIGLREHRNGAATSTAETGLDGAESPADGQSKARVPAHPEPGNTT